MMTVVLQVKDEGKSCGIFSAVNKDLLPGVYLALSLRLEAVLKYLRFNYKSGVQALICPLRFGQELS